ADHTGFSLEETSVRRGTCETPQRVIETKDLVDEETVVGSGATVRAEACMRAPACDGGVDALEGIRGLDWEVGSEDRVGREEGAHAVGGGTEAVGAEARFGVLEVGGGVGGLDGGDDTETEDARLVVGVDNLGVLYAEAMCGLAPSETIYFLLLSFFGAGGALL